MNLFERPVNVCINKDLGDKKHGNIWAKVDGKIEKIPFLIDRPNLVKKGFNPSTYTRVMRQIRQMGIEPDTVELQLNGMIYVYDGRLYKNKVVTQDTSTVKPKPLVDMAIVV